MLGNIAIDGSVLIVPRSNFTLTDQNNGRYVNLANTFNGPQELLIVSRPSKATPKGSNLEVMTAVSVYHLEKDVTIDGKTTRVWYERKITDVLGGYQHWVPNEVEDADRICGQIWDSSRKNAHLSGTI